MTSAEWLTYFQQNRLDRLPVAWDEPLLVDAALRQPIAGSLARFQLGESSDGSRLRQAAFRQANSQDALFDARTITLLIAEEQEHARLLGKALERLEAPRLKQHWSDWVFRRARHVLGISKRLSVLLMGEIVALQYFTTVRNGTPDAVLQRVCDQILHDEKFHVRFQCEYLHRRLARRPVWFQECAWWGLSIMFVATNAVVAWDHQQALEALGSFPDEFLDDSWRVFAAARQAIFTGEAFVWSRVLGQVESPQHAAPPCSRLQLAWTLCTRNWQGLRSFGRHRPGLAQ